MDDPTLIIERHDEDPQPSAFDAPPPRRWGTRILVALCAIAVLGTLGGLLGLLIITRDLPELRSLDDYRPPQTTVVYGFAKNGVAREGVVVGRFAKERRDVVPFDAIPPVMIDAVLASEDAGFFEHEGVDYAGIARCLVKNLLAGRTRCGGSTITQQTVKTFFLTPERTYVRKLKELVLAKRVEEALEKEEILFLYLNQIYFGHGAYGVQAAARVYFGKDIGDIDVAEAALLAGLPQSPSRLDPYKYPERARKRRSYVLGRMRELDIIDAETHDRADAAAIELSWGEDEHHLDNESHFVAHVRRLLAEHPAIGRERLLTGGLEVYTGLDPDIQAAADRALEAGVERIDRRQGWRGPLLHLDPPDAKALKARLDARRAEVEPEGAAGDAPPVVWDLSRFERAPRNAPLDTLLELARTPRFAPRTRLGGIVVAVEDGARRAVVSLGGPVTVVLPLRGDDGFDWARPFSVKGWTAPPRRPSDVLEVGDVVLVTATEPAGDDPHRWRGRLEQLPLTQAAVVVLDPATREVRALSGGYGSGAGTFNRAVQARRQAGSTFKPVVYTAAFASRRFTPVSRCLDAAWVLRESGRSWKPQNYGGTFDGDISLRRALTLSKNVCSVRLADGVGIDAVLDTARRLGIESPLPSTLSLALGAGSVTPLEMVNAYATLADGGRHADPIFVKKVVAPDGEVLYQAEAKPRQAIPPTVAYQTVSVMQSVVEEGTARRVKALDRPVAGKTGTTNDSRDAWFIGFTPDLVAGVWVGFDDNRPLGPRETGGRAAIPIWLDTMTAALEDRPKLDFTAPSDIVFALVDPETGKLAPPEHPGARLEPFLPGTEPTEIVEGEAPADRALWDDYQ